MVPAPCSATIMAIARATRSAVLVFAAAWAAPRAAPVKPAAPHKGVAIWTMTHSTVGGAGKPAHRAGAAITAPADPNRPTMLDDTELAP